MGIKEVKCFRQKKRGVVDAIKKKKRQVLKMIPGQTDIQMKILISDNPKTHPLGGFLKLQFLGGRVAFMHPGSLKPQTLVRNYTVTFDNQFQVNLFPHQSKQHFP